MDAENHAFFNVTIRDFESWYKLTMRVMGQIDSLRNRLVEYENKSKNIQLEYGKKVAEIEQLNKEIREKKLTKTASMAQLQNDLEKRRNEVAEREATLMVRESHLREQQVQLDKLLSAEESKEALEKRGPGRPALVKK